MGILDALLGRTKPAQANLDNLFGLPSAKITLEAAEGIIPSHQAGVCFKPAAGQSFSDTETELNELLSLGSSTGSPPAARLASSDDEFGYRWVLVESADFEELVTQVHLVNTTLQEHGWGPQLLCSVFPFHPGPQASAGSAPVTYFIYLYKRGTFYPFVPAGGERRDNEAELRLKNEVRDDLAIEKELDRWFPIWKLPLS